MSSESSTISPQVLDSSLIDKDDLPIASLAPSISKPTLDSNPTTTPTSPLPPALSAPLYTQVPVELIPLASYPTPNLLEDTKLFEPKKERLSTITTSGAASPTIRPFRPPSRPNSSISRRNRSGSTVSHISSTLASPQLVESAFPFLSPSLLASTISDPLKRKVNPVIVRDFAFEKEDPRHNGSNPAEQWKNQSTSTGILDDELGNEAFASSGSSAFSWGFVTSHETDFPAEDESQQYSEEEEVDSDQQEFVRGIYEAMFDFEPELETEMLLKAGDIVSVVARKCAGWVQAGKVINSVLSDEIGLVPENYLLLLEKDEDFWDEGEELESDLEDGEGEGPATPKAIIESPEKNSVQT